MKGKILGLLFVMAMVVVMLSGCGTKEERERVIEEKTGDVNGDGKIIVGYISKNILDPFHAPINGFAAETLEAMIIDGIIDEWTGVLDGATDGNVQKEHATDCILKGCDYVIILPAEAESSDAAVVKMHEAGINVIVVNSKTDSSDELAFGYVGSDDYRAGEMLAEWVVERCPEGGKYVHCQGVIGNSAQIARGNGIDAVMSKHPEFQKINDFACEWQADKAANVASDMMKQYDEELVAIICDNDDMSSAAQKMCNEAGRSDIVCIGVDGEQSKLQMIKDGEMSATIYQDSLAQIGGAIEMIKTCLAGEEPQKEIAIPFVLVTAENVDEYLK